MSSQHWNDAGQFIETFKIILMQIYTDDSTSVDSIELDIMLDEIKKNVMECW